MRGFAVFDVETTGFRSPVDRIVEIGVVTLAPDGTVEDEWETLVNPGRDIGATHVHGIRAGDVLGAPHFADIADDLEGILVDRALVAHNASFDVRFLSSEMVETGRMSIGATPPSICTMRNSRYFLQTSSAKLKDCCTAAGIDLRNAHSALGDARATGELMRFYLDRAGSSAPWQGITDQVDAFHGWVRPDTPNPHCRRWTRKDSSEARDAGGQWISRITGTRPDTADREAKEYFSLLDRVLLDRELSQWEQAELLGFARRNGLSRQALEDLHLRYLTQLARAAWADGVLEETEVQDFARTATLLGVPAELGSELLSHDRASAQEVRVSGVAPADAPRPSISPSPLVLRPGDRVVVTGPRLLEREEWREQLLHLGLEPGGICKKARLLVAGDPDSLSGKARKAREYGIPIVTEEAGLRLLAQMDTAGNRRPLDATTGH
ncbi:MAG: hypothetical protein L0K65_07715 [Actinomyces sp.]|nr:hypothetical protein [Actinomyces sp.]